MKKCGNCGASLEDDMVFCPLCGTPYTVPKEVETGTNGSAANNAQRQYYGPVNNNINTPKQEFVPVAHESERKSAAIMYVTIIGFLIQMMRLSRPLTPYLKKHANRALIVNIAGILIEFSGWFRLYGSLVYPILAVFGILAYRGGDERIPVLDDVKFFK